MIITISGTPGSGKSTIAKKLAQKLKWPHYYIGALRRKKAKERGMTLAEYNKLGETDSSTDLEVDNYQKKLGQTQDNFIIEGRTSWYMIPHSIKLFFNVDENEGAKRVFKELQKQNSRNEDINLRTITDVLASHRQRKKSDIMRYEKYYNINDVFNANHYDYIFNTTALNAKQVFKQVYSYIQNKISQG